MTGGTGDGSWIRAVCGVRPRGWRRSFIQRIIFHCESSSTAPACCLKTPLCFFFPSVSPSIWERFQYSHIISLTPSLEPLRFYSVWYLTHRWSWLLIVNPSFRSSSVLSSTQTHFSLVVHLGLVFNLYVCISEIDLRSLCSGCTFSFFSAKSLPFVFHGDGDSNVISSVSRSLQRAAPTAAWRSVGSAWAAGGELQRVEVVSARTAGTLSGASFHSSFVPTFYPFQSTHQSSRNHSSLHLTVDHPSIY